MGGIAIIGGSGGLGVASALRLGQRVPVTIGYNARREKAEQLAAQIVEAGGQADIGQVNVTDGDTVKAFLDATAEKWGGLDHIVSAIGPAITFGPLEETLEDDFKRIYETDVFGSFNVIKHGVAALRAGGGGGIVMFVTTAILRTLENDGMSGGPKYGVEGLLRQAAREAGKDNVRLNAIAPGVIDAGIVLEGFEGTVAESVLASCMAQTPLGRMGRPEEISATVDFLLTEGAAYISGQIIAVDGGYSA